MSHNRPFGVVTILILFYILLGETHFTGAPAKTSALTDEQRKEIEKLRSELNEAFEKHDEESVAESGVIVQPGWTKDSKAEPKINAAVVITDAGLEEAKALRAEINKAVAQDSYTPSLGNISGGDSKQVKNLEKQFGLKERGKDVLENILSSTSEREKLNQRDADEHIGSAFDDLDDDKDAPNIVEASAAYDSDIDIRKLQHLQVSKRRTKEVLILKSIEEDFTFDLGDDIDEWEHILHNGEEYFIGRRLTDLLIVRKAVAKYEPGKVLEVGQPISYLETYSYWNLEQQQQEGVILVSSRDKILWYRGNREVGQIELYWEWVIGNTISGLTFFTSESNEYLAVSSNESSRTGYYALNIYQFELESKEFWIAQRMQLQYACGEVTILDTGRDIILAVAQNNTAAIYTFNPHADSSDHIRFQLRRTIESEEIGLESIAGFEMGGRNYLALGGLQPQILLYQQGDFVPKTILGNNFGVVELFFPIPARTYRDDLILLVQHRVDFGTHSLTVLETLIWDGEAFEASIPVPCQLGDHTVYGVSCMLDMQRDEGLKGATLLRRGDEISVIVPRHNAESGLFRLHTELLSKNSELLDLQEIFTFLQDWVKEQDDLIARAQAFLSMPLSDTGSQMQPDLSELETLKTPELHFAGDVGEIHVNDYIWTDQDTKTDLDFILDAIEQLEANLNSGRSKRNVDSFSLSFDSLNFDNVEVEDLLVNRVNNDKFYIKDGALDFEGILNLHSLQVLEEVSSKESRQALEELLEIDGDIGFTHINGVPWNEIRDNLVFRNADVELTNLDVDGEVIVEDILSIDVLNSLNFPDDFLWSSGPATSVVRADKVFTGTLAANAVDTDGTINGMNPFDAITLSEPQDWSGLATFAHLEVSEKLELNGTAHGRGLEDFPSNPTLQEANVILAACSFEQLEVHGTIHLNGNYDDVPLGPLLSDLVQPPSDPTKEIKISSKKTFSTVEFPIDFHVIDNEVSGIAIDQFVTMHTKQDLDISVLEGYVYFNKLNVSGLYNGVDIKELLQNSVKIDEPQNSTTTQLNFVDLVQANSVNILTSLNGMPIEGYQNINDALDMPTAHFDNLHAKVADIHNEIVGQAHLNGLDLRAFLEKRTWTDAYDTGNIFLDELILGEGLETEELHGIDSQFLLNFLDQIDELPEMILDGKIQVDHVIVTGDVQINKLNDHNFDEHIQLTVIWLNRPNYLSTSLVFVETVEVNGDLLIEGDLNGQNLPSLIDDMVFRATNGSVLILAPKSFAKNVNVFERTKVDAINGIPFNGIATKQTIGNFKGSLLVKGNLIVDELEITNTFNEYPLSSINRLVHYDKHLQAYILQGEISLATQMHLEDLTVNGNLNDVINLEHFFEHLLNKNNICILKGKNTFTGRVSIEKGAYIRSLNGYNLLALLNNIVFIHGTEPIMVKAPVSFKGTVTVKDVSVKDTVTASNLNGCSLEEWLAETLRVDQPQEITRYLQFVPGSLDSNSLIVSFLNDVDLSQVITLHTEQNLTSNLLFSEIYLDGSIVSHGPINDVDLQQEYANTLLTFGNQHISTPLTAQSISVLQNVQTNVPANSVKDLTQVATLHDDLVFESPLFFQNITASNVHTSDLMSGINLEQWFNTSLISNKRPQQWITGNWSVRSLSVKSGSTMPSYMMNVMRTPRNDKSFEEMCQKVAKLVTKLQKRVQFVKHLEERFVLEMDKCLENDINQVFVLNNAEQNYILVNSNCWSVVYKWNNTVGNYEMFNSFESGPIDEVLLMPNGKEDLQFITNVESTESLNCSFKSLNAWKLITSNISHSRSFEHKVFAIKASIEDPSRFYGIDHQAVHAISLADSNHTSSWKLPLSANNSSYHFVPSSSDVLLSNGKHMLLLTNNTAVRQKRSVPMDHKIPSNHQKASDPEVSITESILKPNSTTTRKLAFADFEQVVERILSDLIYRLNLEVNITQLSIPESDLYDEHLVQDFIDIMQELRQQQIFPEDMFAQIAMETLEVPANPAQVLAARTVQIIWPVIVEIDEVHNYVRDNDTHEHPVCACITSSLGTMVREVLLLANKDGFNATQDYTQELTAVIQRIRKFQKEIEVLIEKLNAEINQQLTASSDLVETNDDHLKTFVDTPLNEMVLSTQFVSHPNSNGSLLFLENSHIPSRKSGEILKLPVGPESGSHTLLAVTSPKDHLVSGQHDGIKLYIDVLSGKLFQTIGAHKPRSLAYLRIRDETLLAYVEDCCLVHVMIYRGVQGFVEFSKFKTDGEVVKLLGLNLPNKDNEKMFLLATVLNRKIVFYEVIVAGLKDTHQQESIECN